MSHLSGIFGVLYTLRKENNEARIRLRWVILKILLDAWQLFTTVIIADRQGWSIHASGPYGAYLALLYVMVGLLALHMGLCAWVAWCFQEQKFPVVWPLKALRLSSTVFFQTFDVAVLNLLQLGISCRYTGYGNTRMRFDLFPEYGCSSSPHVVHAVVSGLSLGLFIAIALLTNMAEVEVNLLSKRPLALGHSGPAVMAFALKVLLTLVHVFIGWRRVQACLYLGLSLAFAWQFLRWNPHMVNWVNYMRSGVSAIVVWCSATLMLLVFHPGVKEAKLQEWADIMTLLMRLGLAPAFAVGALMSWGFIRYMTSTTLSELKNAKPGAPLSEIFQIIDDPKDVELVARCCRVWKDRYTVDPVALDQARQVIQAGAAMFPNSAYMVLLHANFMIAVMGVSQSGSRRIEDARKLSPGLMSRFIMFVRQQQASQQAAGSQTGGGTRMDLLACCYVEYQRKQRMVVRLHREALQAICNFWKMLDTSKVSFMHLSKALGKVESSVTQAQTAYRVVLDTYGNNPKLVRLYGKFLLTIKNDPWRARSLHLFACCYFMNACYQSEYFNEADRLEEIQNGDSGGGPLLPDVSSGSVASLTLWCMCTGTPLGRMDEIATAVLVITANGEMQVANRHAHVLFGHKNGLILTPSTNQQQGANNNGEEALSSNTVVVGMHSDRFAFHVKLALRKASGVGDDSTFIAMMEVVPSAKGVASLWVANNGTIVACDPHFVAAFGWKPPEMNGALLTTIMAFPGSTQEGAQQKTEAAAVEYASTSPTEAVNRLLQMSRSGKGLQCVISHKYDTSPVACAASIVGTGTLDPSVLEIKIQLSCDGGSAGQPQLLVVNRKGAIVHGSMEILARLSSLTDKSGAAQPSGVLQAHRRASLGPPSLSGSAAVAAAPAALTPGLVTGAEQLAGFNLCDFLPSPWKEMHYKYLRGTTTTTPLSPNRWTCRNGSAMGFTTEMRTASGKPFFMRVSVATAEVAGELLHVIRMSGSSLEVALGERRLRLQTSQEGVITAVEESPAAQLLGLSPRQLTGRALWEIIDWSSYTESGSLPAVGTLMFAALVKRELLEPGFSWRVHVSAPARANESRQPVSELMALARASMRKAVVMQYARTKPELCGPRICKPRVYLVGKNAQLQVHVQLPSEAEVDSCAEPKVFVDLWLANSILGVLEVDSIGRVRAVMEEQTRPAGLLFGMATPSLVGCQLGELLAMPAGRTKPADMLFLNGLKKSSLKATTVESGVKVGPVHVLQGVHSDGLPNSLGVQVVGKPGPNQTLYVVLRSHTAPTLPGGPPVLPRPAAVAMVTSGATVTNRTASKTSAVMLCPAGPEIPTFTAIPGPKATSELLPPGGDELGVLGDGVPVPAVAPVAAANKAATLYSGREKLADMLRSAMASKDASSTKALGSRTNTGKLQPATSPLQSADSRGTFLKDETEVTGADVPGDTTAEGAELGPSILAVTESVNGEDDDNLNTMPGGKERISTWIASQGAYYQNSCDPDGSTKGPSTGERVLHKDIDAALNAIDLKPLLQQKSMDGDLTDKPTRDAAKGGPADEWARRPHDLYQDDDNASEGGQSALSAQSVVLVPSVCEMYNFGSCRFQNAFKLAFLETGNRMLIIIVDGMRIMLLMLVLDEVKVDPNRSQVLSAPNSTSTQYWVQHRYRLHALLTVALLAAVHVVCFALTIHSISTKRDSMLQLGRSGQAQRYMHQIMTDVRSLDMISKSKTDSNLYTPEDTAFFIKRISVAANEMQVRFKEIMDSHHSSSIRGLLFYTTRKVWDGNMANGTDKYSDITIWPVFLLKLSIGAMVHNGARYTTNARVVHKFGPDQALKKGQQSRIKPCINYSHPIAIKVGNAFEITSAQARNQDFSTRFYAMAKEIEQNGLGWVQNRVNIADNTTAGQFLIKSGPDLWKASRQVLDALLYVAVDDARWVDNLQIIFLCVEGAAITSLAACYLAYLSKAVAAQRYKLYSTFILIPLGLTRALASQNTNLTVDDDDDDDSDDGEEKTSLPEDQDGGEAAIKQKRRAMLSVSDTRAENGRLGLTREVSFTRRKSLETEGAGGIHNRKSRSFKARSSGQLSADSIGAEATQAGALGKMAWLHRMFARRGSQVAPLPAEGTLQARRKLLYDSHQTGMLLTPFIVWSALVVALYTIGVAKMRGIVEVLAVHSVVNFMAARTYRAVFFCQVLVGLCQVDGTYPRVIVSPTVQTLCVLCVRTLDDMRAQELAAVDDLGLLGPRRAAVMAVWKVIRDAWYTLQLGAEAYKSTGPDTERFPLVKGGLSYSSSKLEYLFYSNGQCHRALENQPCPGPESRFYYITHSSLDTIMHRFMMHVNAMGSSTNTVPAGLGDEHLDFVYNVGTKDLIDGIFKIQEAHFETIMSLFHDIFVLHVILLVMFWILFGGYLALILNPLLRRISCESMGGPPYLSCAMDGQKGGMNDWDLVSTMVTVHALGQAFQAMRMLSMLSPSGRASYGLPAFEQASANTAFRLICFAHPDLMQQHCSFGHMYVS
ncbi:hypothetical protein VOLCADRAFT_94617 [Volvox carteri f. nagariensis]|uniref:TmcB/TmcC TPR repeats domain-containing protein n=1 Tax=Volvox carteri f. nagariensis TaxID=3068 RepID=D8U599_VOLCA|nr:uncharacterized protein VOLCADRAFT_94617 [Volvox carteri f. nagariensis]EFJ45177.1 hypothetical protein VOLCADRAFT_94617 [Volvox carteri f. nagariensis]|eukprot:XP_002953853.1 hypothetical protein VOLCADRAFT_94617 [Volvox carteri f. nagariensis]